MAKMDWSKARKYSGYEEKYEPGTVLSNGRAVGGRQGLIARADEILAYKKPVSQSINSTKDWMALKAFVASAGLATGDILGGPAGIKQAAVDIYGVAVSSNMTAAIRAIPKKKRRALCKKYRKAHGLLSPRAKGEKRKREMDTAEMAAIREQLKPRD